MSNNKISLVLIMIFCSLLFCANAFAIVPVPLPIGADTILSQHIKEADGITGQDTDTGSGVKTGHIQDGAITTPKIADGAVTAPKMGIVCPDGYYLQYTLSGGWICSVGTPGPMGPAGTMPHYSNVAVVAQSGGDYTDPVTAMNDLATWCGTPSATNPCLLKIMPGVYGINGLGMPPFVDLEGSGRSTTIIMGGVTCRGNEIRHLTVKNNGSALGMGGCSAVDAALISNFVTPSPDTPCALYGEEITLENVDITLSGTCWYYAGACIDGYGNKMVNVSINVSCAGGGGSSGIANWGILEMEHVKIYNNSAINAWGIVMNDTAANRQSLIHMRDSYVEGTWSVLTNSTTEVQAFNSVFKSSIGNYGKFKAASSEINGLSNQGSVATSKIVNCYDGDFNPLPNQ